jgi:hypothetical protein
VTESKTRDGRAIAGTVSLTAVNCILTVGRRSSRGGHRIALAAFWPHNDAQRRHLLRITEQCFKQVSTLGRLPRDSRHCFWQIIRQVRVDHSQQVIFEIRMHKRPKEFLTRKRSLRPLGLPNPPFGFYQPAPLRCAGPALPASDQLRSGTDPAGSAVMPSCR